MSLSRVHSLEVIDILANEPVTMNNHQWGVTPSVFQGMRHTRCMIERLNARERAHVMRLLARSRPPLANKYLPNFYNQLSLNNDREGVTFISSMEGKKYPVYGTQWHPEKPQFEWDADEVTNHTPDAITAMQYMSDFLVSEARKSQHTYPTSADESAALIYNCTLRACHSRDG